MFAMVSQDLADEAAVEEPFRFVFEICYRVVSSITLIENIIIILIIIAVFS